MINPDHLPLIEMGLTFAIVMGFCAWQYWSTDRSLKRDRAEREAREALSRDRSSGDPGHPER